MHWYGGSIAEAVTLSKQRNAIFVVFVEGDNELSVEMAATIDDGAVLSRLADEANFLAIKLKSGSTSYTHFAQIYQFVPVPSLFFIGRNGMPLEVVCAGVQPDNLASRIDRILEGHLQDKLPGDTGAAQASTSSQDIKQQTVNLLESEATPVPPVIVTEDLTAAVPEDKKSELSPSPPKVAKTEHVEVSNSEPEYEVVCDGDVCVRVPRPTQDEPGPSHEATPTDPPQVVKLDESAGSIEEKMERAKELVEIRRKEKAEKEKELEKQREIERREQGKSVAELKRWQAEQELKQIQVERKREKMENDLARQRILEQIAQDRAERRARDVPPAPTAQPQASAAPPAGDSSGRARVQFKMPDGTSHTAHFDANGTVADIHRYVADNLQVSASSFSLWTAFPRRELTASDATLQDLQLAPSAALLVISRRTPPVVARPTAVSTFISFLTQLFTSIILEPSQLLFTWIRARIFPPTGRTPSAPSPSPPASPQSPGNGARRRANIHRLPSDRTADDDNNTWNGNSTQQM